MSSFDIGVPRLTLKDSLFVFSSRSVYEEVGRLREKWKQKIDDAVRLKWKDGRRRARQLLDIMTCSNFCIQGMIYSRYTIHCLKEPRISSVPIGVIILSITASDGGPT